MPNRCASHPGRPAVDSCPVCDRPRCGADAALAPGGGCLVCQGGPTEISAPPTRLELTVRGVLGAHLTALIWGFVEAQYVQAGAFQFLAPLVLGAFTGGVALWAAGQPRGADGTRMRLVATAYAVLGCGFGFIKEGTFGVFSTNADVLVPYALAAGTAWIWTLPPKKRA